MSCGAQWCNPPWSPEHCCGHTDAWGWPSVQLTSRPVWDYCGCSVVRGWPTGVGATLEGCWCQPGLPSGWGRAESVLEGPAGVGPQGKVRVGHTVLVRLMDSDRNGACPWLHPQNKSLQIPAPPAHALKFINESPSHVTQALFKLLPLCWESE